MTQIALKLAYIGDRYHGFQIQSNAYTVESEIFSSLQENGIVNEIKEARYSRAGRTDTGVHALGQVISFDTEFSDRPLPRIMNSSLPRDIWVWAHAQVPSDFNSRRDAVRREYRYFLYDAGYRVSDMRNSTSLFVGTHDFSNFTKEREDTIRTIDTIEIRERDGFIIIDVSAPSFLWNMVRRIVTALVQIGAGVRDRDWLEEMLVKRGRGVGVGYAHAPAPAPAYGLVLRDVVFEGIEWVEDRYSKERMRSAFMDAMVRHATIAEIYSDS